jgi:uncharacterized protein (TIGR03067 family)
MRLAGWLIVGIALISLSARAAEGDKEKKLDAAKLIGTWKLVSAEKGGQRKGEDELKDQTLTITRDSWALKTEAGKFVMKYELDASKTPARVKLTMTESPFGGGATANGIVAVNGDEMKLCYATEGDAPAKFESKEGSEHRFVVLKRVKKK